MARALMLFVLLLPHLILAQAKPPAWEDLNPRDQELWIDYVSGLRQGEFPPVESYRFYWHLLDSPPANGVSTGTTETMLQKRFLELEIASRINWSDTLDTVDEPTSAVLKQWVLENPLTYPTTESIDLQSIFVRKLSDETSESARARADKALQMLESGEAFANVAMLYSDARSAGQGGTVGTITRGQIASQLDELLFSSPPNKLLGPIPNEHGYHIFRIMKKTDAFDLANPADYSRAVAGWKKVQASRMVQQQVEQWSSQHQPQANDAPASATESWLLQPWIRYQSRSEPFGLVYKSIANTDLNYHLPAAWNDFWREEAQLHRNNTIASIAAYEGLKHDDRLVSSVKIAMPIYHAVEVLRNWYAQQQPTEAELKAYYQEIKPQLKDRTLYSYVLFQVPLQTTTTATERQDFPRKMTELLDTLYRNSKATAPEDAASAEKFFQKLSTRFPGSQITSASMVEAVSPFIDPVLYRTAEQSLSRPFDTGSDAAILYVTDKATTAPAYDDIREGLIDSWRRIRLNNFTDSIRQKAGIN